PVLSYIFLGGKCKNCKQKISIIYPIIEILTSFLFYISYKIFGLSEEFFISLVISSLVVIIFVSDSKYMIISDSPLIVSTILILIIKFIYNGYKDCFISIIYGLIVFGVMYLTMLLGNALFKKESLGGGDIKLSFISGLSLGPLLGLFYIILASFLAFPYAIYISIKNKDTMLPFGPFLATSLLIIYLNYDFFYEFLITLLHLK
ncbi:MAG: A24 family peptidase, partial [Bacilli bacterium]|nr:A24 family peptidase [Bacilli bacterium]